MSNVTYPRGLAASIASLPLALLLSTACSDSQAAGHAPSAASLQTPVVADLPLEAYRLDLLDRALAAASAMPLYPHIKNRSRAQETVFEACFELDQPGRALSAAESIADWRRGNGYAEYAFYCAQRDELEPVEDYLTRAEEISRNTDPENPQDWQRDQIRSRIAATHLWLGDAGGALEFETGLEDSEAGRVGAVKAQLLAADELESQLEHLRQYAASGSFEQVQNALQAGTQLYARFFGDVEQRQRIESTIKSAWAKMPIQVRLETSCELTEQALAYGDQAKAMVLAEESRAILESGVWEAESQVAFTARVAVLRFRAGAQALGRAEVDEARAIYSAKREEITDIWRAGALRPLAESYHSMGDRETAMAIYKQAVEAGLVNPNSRPRAEDLTATCLSLAIVGLEPDIELWGLLQQAQASLGDPW